MTTALFMKTNAASSSQSGSSLYRGMGGGDVTSAAEGQVTHWSVGDEIPTL